MVKRRLHIGRNDGTLPSRSYNKSTGHLLAGRCTECHRLNIDGYPNRFLIILPMGRICYGGNKAPWNALGVPKPWKTRHTSSVVRNWMPPCCGCQQFPHSKNGWRRLTLICPSLKTWSQVYSHGTRSYHQQPHHLQWHSNCFSDGQEFWMGG